ncbi:MAG: TRAP transporter large permease subunit, partial [Oscillospiraceae bacterium]|nr:TRAP transporter large permease subunit [Oscillospiraceae bacterium]
MEGGIILALVGMVTLIVLVLMGVHIAVALGTVGFFGLVACLNLPKAVAMVGIQAYSGIATFDYAVIPLFILMGMLATGIGISTECYDTLAKWLGRIPGGLGVATTLGCTAFGTLNGSALVTGSVFAKIAAPEMRRYGYNTNLTYGLIAASGNIGQFIPPSILIVIFGALSGDSIGRLLMAAIAPGLALAIGFSLFTVIAAIVKPSLFPRVEQRFTWKEKLVSLKNLIPIAIVAVVIIGGIFFGICSSAEAGAIGCLVFFLMGLIKRTPFRKIWRSIMDTVENMTMLFLILACSGMFAKFMTVSGLAQALTNLVTQAHLSPIVFMVAAVVVFLILGCFLDAYSSIALTIISCKPGAMCIVPDRCNITYDRRLVPTETPDDAVREMQEIIDQLSREDPDFRATVKVAAVPRTTYTGKTVTIPNIKEGWRIAEEHPFVQAAAKGLRDIGEPVG